MTVSTIFTMIIIAFSVLLLVGVCVYPYIWGDLLKARMLKKLRVTARASGFKYRRSYKNIFFVRNRSPKYDLLIYDDKRLYAVKLWSAYFVRSTLVINRAGKIRERKETRPVFDMSDGRRQLRRVNGFVHSVPKTKIAKRYLVGREVQRVLLVYPSYKSMVFFDGKRDIPINTGDEIFDKIVYSPSAFMTELKSKGTVSESIEKDKKKKAKDSSHR